MVDFHLTRAGQRFYEGTVPNLVRSIEKATIELKRIADGLERPPSKMELMIKEWEESQK